MSSNKNNERIKQKPKAVKSKGVPLWVKITITAWLIVMIGLVITYRVPFTRTEVHNDKVTFGTDYIKDSSLELGNEQVRENGVDGNKQETVKVKHYLYGKVIDEKVISSNVTQQPVQKIIAQGTKKYQYMWCSNSSYRYYTNDQFKDANTGFTHKSKDYCAKSGQGTMTGLSDTPPNPSVTTYQRSSPTSFRCYDSSIFYSSIDCHSY